MCKKLLNLVQVALTKILRNEAKIYQKRNFIALRDIFLTSPGCCLGLFAFYFVVLVLCNAVVIRAGILPFTQAQANVFDFTAFVYIYFAFTSLLIVVKLCTLLRCEEIVLKYG